jgi:MHS family alpha-ketoglutarate permease-like MFS transporter
VARDVTPDEFGRTSGGRTVIDRYRLAAVCVGNSLEWFDWNIYAVFSVFFAPHFFPPGNDGGAYLNALLIFAVGFLFRPLGAIILTDFTDRHGRRAGLTLAMTLMAIGTFLLAVSPTYREIGFGAPLLLLVARILTGVSTGGDFASTIAYLTEVAPRNRRSFYSSLAYISVMSGSLIATLLAASLVGLLGRDVVSAWAWRIPFAFGTAIGLMAMYMRRALKETDVYLAASARRVRRPTLEVVRRHPTGALQVVGFTAGATTVFYTFVVYLPAHVQKAFGMAPITALWVAAVPQVILICILPIVGLISDRFGRKPPLIVFASGFILLSPFFFHILDGSGRSLLTVMTAAMVLFAGYAAVGPTAMAELFPTQVRSAGLGLPYAATVAAFGGTAPYVIESLDRHHMATVFPWYVVALSLISLITYLTARETSNVDLGI